MELHWSLKEIYPSFEDEKFNSDIKELENKITLFAIWANSLSIAKDKKEKLEEFIGLEAELYNISRRLLDFCSLTLSVDSKNVKALKNLDIVEDIITGLAEPKAKFEAWLGSIKDLEVIIQNSDILKQHRFYLMEKQHQSNYILSEKEEAVIAKMRNTGSGAFEKLRDLLTSNLMVDIELQGEKEKLPLTVIRNMAYDKDQECRKKAYFAELEAYSQIEDSIAACLNGIKGEVVNLDKLRGYKSPLEETLINSRMTKRTLDAMLQAIRESLPVFHKFYLKKAELLGHKKGLPFYDLLAPVGEFDKKYSYEEAKCFVVSNFNTFSRTLGEYALKAFDQCWIDAEPRKGKVGGAFCENLFYIGESRIMANFNGKFSDVVTLAHELGHGYHGECLMGESILNTSYPMPIAETASTFCETIVKKAALKNASKQEALFILESEISDCAQVLVDILSRFIFESRVFEGRKEGSLTAKELNKLMLEAQREAYGEGLDENYLHPYMWICKPHYYSAEESFYNFPYAFGLLFAKGLYSMYKMKGQGFAVDYDRFLGITGKNDLVSLGKALDIDMESLDFWRGSIKIIQEDINIFLNL